MKTYRVYKDSGAEEIGEIPLNWIIAKLKAFCKKITDGSHFSPEIRDDGYPYITVRDIRDSDIDFVNCKRISEADFLDLSHNGCKPKENDILLTKDGTIGKAVIVGKQNDFVILSSLGLITPDLSILDSKFLRYFLISSKNVDQMFSFLHGAALTRLTIKLIKDLIVTCPPMDHQKSISKYLDHKIHLIDILIEKKQKQIELLKELRTVTIYQAVTKGLDPNVKMKSSDVEWLGEVPKHWKVKRLKYLCSIKTGEKDTIDREDNGEYPFFVRSQTVERINSYSYDGEAVLTAGDGVGVGKVFHYYKGKFDYHQRVYKISDFTEILCKYIFYYMKENFHKEVMKISAKSTVDSLRLPMFLNFPVAYGKIEEQKQIIFYIDSKTERIDNSLATIEKEIDLLQEFRTVLICETVTGKIDVRDEIIL